MASGDGHVTSEREDARGEGCEATRKGKKEKANVRRRRQGDKANPVSRAASPNAALSPRSINLLEPLGARPRRAKAKSTGELGDW